MNTDYIITGGFSLPEEFCGEELFAGIEREIRAALSVVGFKYGVGINVDVMIDE